MGVAAAKAVSSVVTDGWHRAFRDLPRQHGFERLTVEGRLPAGLRGTLYRNGPEPLLDFGRRYGTGSTATARCRRCASTGRVRATGAVRIVDGPGLLEEQRRGRASTATTARRRRGVAAGRGPARRDQEQRQHLGDDLAGPAVRDARGGAADRAVDRRSADAGRARSRRRGGAQLLRASALRAGASTPPTTSACATARTPMLDLYELPDAGAGAPFASVTLAGPTMIHDFIATDRYLIFFAPPLRLRVFASSSAAAPSRTTWSGGREEGTEVLVVPSTRPIACAVSPCDGVLPVALRQRGRAR